MSRVFIHTLWIAALLLPALALGQPATQSGELSVNSPLTTLAATTPTAIVPAATAPALDAAVPVVAPIIAPVVGPVLSPAPSPPVEPVVAAPLPVIGPPLAAPATQATVAITPASQPATVVAGPEAYRSPMEKMPIHDTDTGSEVPAAGPTTQTSPGQALKTGLSQTGIGTAVQVGGALFIVVGLIFIARAMAKKWVPGVGASNGKNVIEILARYPLAKAQSLVMVRIGSQIVVLNQTKEASTSVLVISDQTEVAGILGQIQGGKPSSIQAGFTKLLANAQMDLERQDMSEPDAIEARMQANHVMEEEQLDEQLDEMAAAKRQLMELRTQVRTIRENLK